MTELPRIFKYSRRRKERQGSTVLCERRRRILSLADSVAPKVLYPRFFLGRGNKEVGPLLKKTESRQYRVGPADCLRKQWTVFGILSRIRGDLAFHHEWKPQCSRVVTKNVETFPKQQIRSGIFSWIVLCLDYWIFWTAYLKYRLFHYWNFQHRKIIKKCFAGTFNIFITLYFHSLNIYIKQSNINLYNSYTFLNIYFGLLTI